METLDLSPMLKNLNHYVRTEPLNLFDAVKTTPRPTVVLTAHTANWDLLAAATIAMGISVVAVGRKARAAVGQDLLCTLREQYGMRTIWRDDPGSAKDLILAFRRNTLVAALIDQDTQVGGRLSPFFGVPVQTPDALIALAQRHAARILTAFMIRNGNGRYTMRVEPIAEGLSIDEIISEYHRRLERVICEHPEQWVWMHKRWRTLPHGKRLSSDEYVEHLHEKCILPTHQEGV
jgi:KDO2-lipid IV(A) lauroyltransferase